MNPHSSPRVDPTAPVPPVFGPPVGKMAAALIALGIVGLPLAWFGAGLAGRPDLQAPAVVTGLIVLAASLLGLVPLVLTRHSDPLTKQVSGRMGHVVSRLFLTAGGLVLYLFLLPEAQRLPAGLIALGWYLVSWAVELFFVAPSRPQASA